ncbi:MAG TPA: hypothetical protein QGH10_13290 [Armatimonadota bacterium]|nr:hypothetical protein [Armatimonadota bacterium]
MRRLLIALCCVALLSSVVVVSQAQDYSLADYMPQTTGSTWTMTTTGENPRTSTIEITGEMEVGELQVPMAMTKDAEGVARRGTLELVTADAYTIYGMMFRGRGEDAELRTMLYNPAVEFPGTLTVGAESEATTKIKFGENEFEITQVIKIEAVEAVTVPAGTFEDCLKVVTTSKSGRGDRVTTTWYAKGVGAVQTERPSRRGEGDPTISQLTEYTIAE